MHISARADYAVRAALELAARSRSPTHGAALALAQDIPARFLEGIMASLRRAGLVRSQRGADGGSWLARPAGEMSIPDGVTGVLPEQVSRSAAEPAAWTST